MYFGIRNNTNANGNTMTGASPSGAAVFGFSSGGATRSTTSSSTTVNNAASVGLAGGEQRVGADRTGGATTLVATGGNPADTGNGAIQRLFNLDSGSSFTFTAVINATSPSFSGVTNPGVRQDPDAGDRRLGLRQAGSGLLLLGLR